MSKYVACLGEVLAMQKSADEAERNVREYRRQFDHKADDTQNDWMNETHMNLYLSEHRKRLRAYLAIGRAWFQMEMEVGGWCHRKHREKEIAEIKLTSKLKLRFKEFHKATCKARVAYTRAQNELHKGIIAADNGVVEAVNRTLKDIQSHAWNHRRLNKNLMEVSLRHIKKEVAVYKRDRR